MPYILIGIFVVWFVEVVRIPQRLMQFLHDRKLIYKSYYGQTVPRRIKPFDCVECFSFWISISYSLTHENFFTSFLYGAATSYCAYALMLLTNRLR